jgi:hypothetical protein
LIGLLADVTHPSGVVTVVSNFPLPAASGSNAQA